MFRTIIRYLPLVLPVVLKFWQSRRAGKANPSGTTPRSGR